MFTPHFWGFNAAQQLQNRLEQNRKLNEVIHNVARERGMSAMYLGNKTENILKSLQERNVGGLIASAVTRRTKV